MLDDTLSSLINVIDRKGSGHAYWYKATAVTVSVVTTPGSSFDVYLLARCPCSYQTLHLWPELASV